MSQAPFGRDFLERYLTDESFKNSPFYKYLNPNFSLAQGTSTTQPGDTVKSQIEQLYGGFVNPIERAKEFSAAYGDMPSRLRSGTTYLFGVNEQLQNQAAADRRAIQNKLLLEYEKTREGIGNEMSRLQQSGVTGPELDKYRQEAQAAKTSYWQPYLAARQYGKQMQELDALAGRIASTEAYKEKVGLGDMAGRNTKRIEELKKLGQGLYDLYSTQSAADLTASDYGVRPSYDAAARALRTEFRDAMSPFQGSPKNWGKEGGKDPYERREGRAAKDKAARYKNKSNK